MRGRAGEHRAERVDRAEKLFLAGNDRERGDHAEDQDRGYRRPGARTHAAQPIGQLLVTTHRVGEPTHANDARVCGNQEDRRGEQTHVDLAG